MKPNFPNTRFSLPFEPRKKLMGQRVRAIVDASRGQRGRTSAPAAALILLICLLCANLVSCAPVPNAKDYASLEKYIEDVSLPDNLTLSFDPAKVVFRESATVYYVTPIRFSADKLIPALMIGDVSETVSYAEGMQYRSESAGVRDYLTVYDGGESFGTQSGTDGGFNYNLERDGVMAGYKLQSIISSSRVVSMSTLANPGLSREDYRAEGELAGLARSAALRDIVSRLSNAGAPELMVRSCYFMDIPTIKAHAELSGVEYEFSEADEGYYFNFAQVVDDIPIMDIEWEQNVNGSVYPRGSTSGEVWYTAGGIECASFSNLVSLTGSDETLSLISPSEAVEALVRLLSDVISEYKYNAVTMELIYVKLPSGDSMVMRPAWIFDIIKTEKLDNGTDYQFYVSYVFDAATGELLSVL